jgi:bacterioferritin
MNTQNVIRELHTLLGHGLLAINQCFLHARMLKHHKVMRLADVTYRRSIDNMKHADQIVERIVQLGGLPSIPATNAFTSGADVVAILHADIVLERGAQAILNTARAEVDKAQDSQTSSLLLDVQKSSQEHLAFLEEQEHRLAAMGLADYLKTML